MTESSLPHGVISPKPWIWLCFKSNYKNMPIKLKAGCEPVYEFSGEKVIYSYTKFPPHTLLPLRKPSPFRTSPPSVVVQPGLKAAEKSTSGLLGHGCPLLERFGSVCMNVYNSEWEYREERTSEVFLI